ncbi:MAG: mucoidy inhibitor MuiA family protein [Bacteroidota bacterium]
MRKILGLNFSLLFSLLILSMQLMAADDRNVVNADLKSVTVYKSGAEMQHNTSATLKAGSNELVIENIANALDINSIQIKAASEVTIMGVEFANNYIANKEKTPRIKLLEDSIEQFRQSIAKLDMVITNDNDLLSLLKLNREIKGTQTGVSVAELMKLMDYYMAKTVELQNEISGLNEKKEKLAAQKATLRSQLYEEQSKNTKVAGRLILQLSAAVAGKYDFAVSYITPNAHWTPNYDIKVENTKSPLHLIYKAAIQQTTGIEWKKVKLSLSTSTPHQFGTAPLLTSWFLKYTVPMVRNESYKSASNTYSWGADKDRQDDVAVMEEGGNVGAAPKMLLRGRSSNTSSNEPIYVVDGVERSSSYVKSINPQQIKSMNVLKDASSTSIYGSRGANGVIVISLKNGLQDYVSTGENALNLTFDIDLPYTIPSNGKPQTATLKSMDVSADYKHYSVPKLDKEVYLMAYIADWQKLSLLPGEANIILEGTYVGKTTIDPNSTLDTLSFTLGRDKRVAVKREKLTDFSSVKFLGTNKLQKFSYELTVKNNKKEAVELLLKDQFPLTTNKDIEVELIDDGNAEVNKDLGVLNWKLNLNAGESKKIRFTYSVKYPKDKSLNLN